MPSRLLKHEFQELLPKEKRLPPPPDGYLEMETAKAFGYPWGAWLTESPILRAQMMAHELHRGMREAYKIEAQTAASGRDEGARTPAPWDAIRDRFFGKQ